MQIHREAKPTFTPFELDKGDELIFQRADGSEVTIELISTSASIIEQGPARHRVDYLQIAAYGFNSVVKINGKEHTLEREVGNQNSFHEPLEVEGVRLWLDAVNDIFVHKGGFMKEKDWTFGFVCMPRSKARFVVQDVNLSICPEPISIWLDIPDNRLDVGNCYNGENCWMGPYHGGLAHCGLDINMSAGTTLYSPIDFDDNYYFHTLEAGFNNNRWRGIRRWEDGSEWWLQSHHLEERLVPEHEPLKRGTPYATAAGVLSGDHEHAHFMFRIIEQGGEYFVDPWLLFQEMFRQRSA